MTEVALPLAQKAAQLFAERGIDNARLEAELLLAHILGIKRLDLYLQFERPLSVAELEQFRALVRRRLKREPLQYLIGTVQFRHIELQVDARVLIPRPETEVLAGCAIAWAAGRPEPKRALDIGTGSGAIALSLLHENAVANAVASDVSADALAVAHANAEHLGLAPRIHLRRGSVWEPVGEHELFDIVISNPPYIGLQERDTLQPEVREWEPASALFAEDDGLRVIREIVARAPAHLENGGLLALEVAMTQAQAIAQEVGDTGWFDDVKVIRDLSGRDRVVTAVRKART